MVKGIFYPVWSVAFCILLVFNLLAILTSLAAQHARVEGCDITISDISMVNRTVLDTELRGVDPMCAHLLSYLLGDPPILNCGG